MLPIMELARRERAAARYFGEDGETFVDLKGKFCVMLGEGTLHDEEGWLANARLWRLIFLQDKQGFFEPSVGLAFALRAVEEDKIPKPYEMKGIQKIVERADAALGADDMSDDDVDEARRASRCCALAAPGLGTAATSPPRLRPALCRADLLRLWQGHGLDAMREEMKSRREAIANETHRAFQAGCSLGPGALLVRRSLAGKPGAALSPEAALRAA